MYVCNVCNVCMYVCMCVCMYVCVYVCMYVYERISYTYFSAWIQLGQAPSVAFVASVAWSPVGTSPVDVPRLPGWNRIIPGHCRISALPDHSTEGMRATISFI